MKQTFDCVIVGSGIAGMTSAIYLKRANKNILLIEKEVPGGLMNKTSSIENYPGYTNIDGPSLVMNIYNQINKLQIPILFDEVVDIQHDEKNRIILKKSDPIFTKNIIISTGRYPRKLNIENEEQLIGHGISYCALCDGAFFKGEDVCVIGGGNSALEESLYLSNICHKVTIINRGDKLRADSIFQDKIKEKNNVEILYNSKITSINGTTQLESITVNQQTIPCKGLFVYIGLDPNIEFLKNLNLKEENGYIIVDHNMQTNIEGIYACGDVIKKDVYQIITAASEGAIAATSVQKRLNQ